MTTEPEQKLKQIFSNLKNFFVLDIDAFVKSMNVDLTKQTSVYLVNSEIEKLILSQAKLKKYQGIIYINRNLSKNLHDSLKARFRNAKEINKIIECTGFEKNQDDTLSLLMDDIPGDK